MTEEEIVYSIIETLNANEYNNDNKITERMVRNLIYQYRGEILRKYYSEGDEINEECFQLIELNFKRKGVLEFQANASAGVMEFSLRQGFFLEKFGVTIPVVSSMEYSLSQEADLPLAKKIGTLITLKYQKSLVSCIKPNSPKAVVLKAFQREVRQSPKDESIKADLYAVLVDPSKGKDYDWLSTPFPFPGEKIDELKTTILRKEFQITANVKSDEIQNARVDNIRYHENTNLEQ